MADAYNLGRLLSIKMFKRKRTILILILLTVVVFYATVFLGISFQPTQKTLKFLFLKENKQVQRFPAAGVKQGKLKKNNFEIKSFPSDTNNHEVNSTDKRSKVDSMFKTKEKKFNFSEKDESKNRLMSEYSVKINSHAEGETVTQKLASGNKNIEADNKTTTKDKLSSPLEKNILYGNEIAIENVNIRRGFDGTNSSYCHLPFKYGEMCPKSYTQLGGVCRMSNKSELYCPDIRFKANNPHRQGQLITTRMLKIFDLVCKKHDISYWLTGGTLLGAARHKLKGNIPWDTDNDVGMFLKDYIKFFQTAAKDLPGDIFFQNCISDPALRPSNPLKAFYYSHSVVGIYIRHWNPRLRDTKSCYTYCMQEGCSWHDGMMIDIFVQDTKDPGIFPLKQMLFEGFLFPVPNNWRNQLEENYNHSDFMKVPEKEKNRRPVDFPDTEHSCDEVKALRRNNL